MIKKYYDKFLEIINDKLIENIEQNMVLKCNNKEITELNKNNVEIFNKLQKQLQDYKQNEELEEPDSVCENLKEQIKNMENTIKENLKLKNGILKTYKENMIKKKQLKLILLNFVLHLSFPYLLFYLFLLFYDSLIDFFPLIHLF